MSRTQVGAFSKSQRGSVSNRIDFTVIDQQLQNYQDKLDRGHHNSVMSRELKTNKVREQMSKVPVIDIIREEQAEAI